MATRHPSAIKRHRQNEKRRTKNQAVKSALKTITKKFLKAVSQNDLEAAKALFLEAAGKFDRACSHGVVHKNMASRKKSRLALRLNKAMATPGSTQKSGRVKVGAKAAAPKKKK